MTADAVAAPDEVVRGAIEAWQLAQGAARAEPGGSGLRKGLDDTEVLSVLVHNVLVSRGPAYRTKEWASQIGLAALGLTARRVCGLQPTTADSVTSPCGPLA